MEGNTEIDGDDDDNADEDSDADHDEDTVHSQGLPEHQAQFQCSLGVSSFSWSKTLYIPLCSPFTYKETQTERLNTTPKGAPMQGQS